MSPLSRLLTSVLLVCLPLNCSLAETPQSPVPAVLRLFNRYPLVIFGEDHWQRSLGDFYNVLLRSPQFTAHANTLVLECGNSLYQPILDRYENGEDVPFEQIAQVWRNTTKVMSWESPIYASLIETVRNVNRELLPEHRIRVLAADAPIDWEKVKSRRDYEHSIKGDAFMASLIQREVLAKNRKALVIMGINHVTRGGDRQGFPDVTTLLERRAPHSTYVILLAGLPAESDPALRGTAPSFYALRGTRLGRYQFYPGRRAEEVADAFIYRNHMGEIAWPDWNALQADRSYFEELRRRHLIEFGCPLDLEKWKRMAKPCS